MTSHEVEQIDKKKKKLEIIYTIEAKILSEDRDGLKKVRVYEHSLMLYTTTTAFLHFTPVQTSARILGSDKRIRLDQYTVN